MAFAPFIQRHDSFKASLMMRSRPDASGAIEEAFQAAKKFGPDSQQARLAWEKVEELDASDVR